MLNFGTYKAFLYYAILDIKWQTLFWIPLLFMILTIHTSSNTYYPLNNGVEKKKVLQYGFCKKSLRKDEPLTSWKLFSSLWGTCRTSYKVHILITRYFVTRQVVGSSNFQWTRSYQITPLCTREIISRQPSFLVQKMKWQKVFQPRGSIRSLLPRASFSFQLRYLNFLLGKECKSRIVSLKPDKV